LWISRQAGSWIVVKRTASLSPGTSVSYSADFADFAYGGTGAAQEVPVVNGI